MTQEYHVITNPHNPLFGKSYDEVTREVQQDGCALKYVLNQTEKICKIAIQQNLDTFKYVKNQTEAIRKMAAELSLAYFNDIYFAKL